MLILALQSCTLISASWSIDQRARAPYLSGCRAPESSQMDMFKQIQSSTLCLTNKDARAHSEERLAWASAADRAGIFCWSLAALEPRPRPLHREAAHWLPLLTATKTAPACAGRDDFDISSFKEPVAVAFSPSASVIPSRLRFLRDQPAGLRHGCSSTSIEK